MKKVDQKDLSTVNIVVYRCSKGHQKYFSDSKELKIQ